MAYYNYKRLRDAIPGEWKKEFEKKWLEETGEEFQGTADYDGDYWCMGADYIEYLHSELEKYKNNNVNKVADYPGDWSDLDLANDLKKSIKDAELEKKVQQRIAEYHPEPDIFEKIETIINQTLILRSFSSCRSALLQIKDLIKKEK